MSYENFDPNDLLIQSYSTKPSGFVHRIPHGIRAIHLPTGTVVTCDADRSQHKNRHDALTQLWELVHGKPTYQELAAQVEAFKKIREDWKGLAINDAKTLIAFIEAADKAPQQHLAEIRAEVGRAGFVAGFKLGIQTPKPAPDNCASAIDFVAYRIEKFANIKAHEYADSIRKGEVE